MMNPNNSSNNTTTNKAGLSVEDDNPSSKGSGSRRPLIAIARTGGHERSVSSLVAPASSSSSSQSTKSCSSDTSSPLLSYAPSMLPVPAASGIELPSLALVSSSTFRSSTSFEERRKQQLHSEASDDFHGSHNASGGSGCTREGSADDEADFGFVKVPSARGRGSPLLPSIVSPPQKNFMKVGPLTDPSSPTALFPPMPTFEYENADWRFQLKSSELCIDHGLNPVAVYVIQVYHGDTSWEIVRRFSQFYDLDIQLRYLFPNNRLPKLPRKYLFKSGTDPLLIKERTTLLQRYLSELGANKQVGDCDIWKEWVMDENPQHLFRLTQPLLSGSLVRKRSMRLGRRCFFVLTRELLVFYEGDRPKSLFEPPTKIMLLDDATLRVNKDQKSFIITGKNGTSWTLEASNATEANAWTGFITNSINALAEAKASCSVPFPPTRVPQAKKKEGWETGVVSKELKSAKSFQGLRTDKTRDVRSVSFAVSSTTSSDLVGPSQSQDSNNGSTRLGTGTPSTSLHSKTFSLARGEAADQRMAVPRDDGIPVRARSDSLPSSHSASSSLYTLPGEPMMEFIEKQKLKGDEKERDFDPKRLTLSSISMSTQNLPTVEDLPSRPRGATLMMPSRSSGQKPRASDSKNSVVLERLRQRQEAVSKDLHPFLQSLQSREFLQSKNSGQQSEVTSQLIVLTKAVLAAKPEDLLDSSLCKDTIMKISQLAKHPMTNKILFYLSSLARLVDAYKSQIPVEKPTVPPLVLRSPPLSPNVEASQSPRTPTATSAGGSPTLSARSATCEDSNQQVSTESKTTEEPQAIAQPLGELHTEPVTGPPNPRPQRRTGVDRDHGGLHREHKSLRSSAKKVLCRICEEEYPQSLVKEHTKFCIKATNADTKNICCNDRLLNMLKLFEEHRQRVSPTGKMKETYSQIVTLCANACALSYGNESEEQKCFDVLGKLQLLQVQLTYDDVGLVTYLRRFISIIEEKYGIMKEIARIQREESDKNRKRVNFWAVFSLMRPHMQESPSSTVPDELLFHNKSRVTINDFEIIKRISSGAYGKVYLARKKKTKDLFAVKVQNKSDLLRKNMVDNVIAERRILSNVKTPFVVKLFYAFQSDQALFLVMEYCPGGDVATLLRNLGAFDLDMARVYAAETVLSLESLHKMSYIHRDLKPDNLLVNEKGHLLLTDFGLSSIGVLENQGESSSSTKPSSGSSTNKSQPNSVEQNNEKPRIVGTPDYLAPEMLLGTGHGPEVDWWALGIMIYEFLTGIPPFNAETPEDIFDRILRRDLVWPEDMDPNARDIIDKLLNPEASKRLGHNGANEVKAHPFFEGINWDTLLQESREDIFVPQLDNPEDTSYHEDHRQSKGGSSMDSLPVTSGQDFTGFEFTNTDSLIERTLSLANEGEEDDNCEETPSAGVPEDNQTDSNTIDSSQ